MSDNAKEWIKDIIIAVIIAVIVIQFVRPTIVKQTSMEPTMQANNYLFLSKQAYTLFGDPKRGDIVVFQSHITNTEDGSEKLLIKRVIGLPGDKVEIKDGYVYVNDNKLKEDYVQEQGVTYSQNFENMVYEVPDESLFVMGDNRSVSIDSRFDEVGFVPMEEISGKVILRVYPFDEIGTF